MVAAHFLSRLRAWPASLFSRGKAAAWIGVDIGGRAIKLAELEPSGGGMRLIRYLIQELPEAHTPQAEVAWRRPECAEWLQAALREVKAGPIHVVLGGTAVAIRREKAPLMSKAELDEAMKWQVKEDLPFPVQEASVSVEVLGEIWDKDLKKQDVLVAAAFTPTLNELLAFLQRCGAHVASVTPATVALWKGVTAFVPQSTRGSVAIVDIGAWDTQVVILKDGQIRLVRSVAVGSDSLTEALIGETVCAQGKVAIDRAKAEALKRRYGVLSDAAEGETEDGVPLVYLASLMRPALEQLLTELARLLDFYKVQLDAAGVSGVLLCGGGANLKSLGEFLSGGLGLNVERLNVLARMPDRARSAEPEAVAEDGPRLTLAIGAAVNHGAALNVLAAARRRTAAAAQGMAFPLAGKAAARWGTIAAVALAAGLAAYAGWLDARIRHVESAWRQVEPSYQQYLETSGSVNALQGTIGQLQHFLDAQPVWEGMLKELGETTPGGIQLDELLITKEDASGRPARLRLALKGTASSSNRFGGQGLIAQYVTALEDAVFFSDMALVRSDARSGDRAGIQFDITGRLE
ncbi:MAG: type IV pilus assembly protein PilM [Candidatus Omnitrophica bacterium]|nr:type IV pilus assembly protein PilM [Candidatus Omnitrophota bacterium]